MSSSPDPFRVRRKIRKLRSDPRAFFHDSRVPGIRTLVERFWSDGSPGSEPRLLGSITWAGKTLNIERLPKKIAEPDLATVVFTPRTSEKLVQRRLLRDLLVGADFVGFRNRYLFAFEFDLGAEYGRCEDLGALLRASDAWGSRFVAGVRNVVFIDPENALPFMVRATNHDIRLVVCATEQCRRLDLLQLHAEEIDVLIAAGELLRSTSIAARRVIEVGGEEDIPAALRRVIIDHKEKEKNVLVPVYGDSGYIEDIDELNASRIEAVLLLREPPPDIPGARFDDLVGALADRTRALLLREVRFHQYRDLCERQDLRRLLRLSLEDGCRYDVRC